MILLELTTVCSLSLAQNLLIIVGVIRNIDDRRELVVILLVMIMYYWR